MYKKKKETREIFVIDTIRALYFRKGQEIDFKCHHNYFRLDK